MDALSKEWAVVDCWAIVIIVLIFIPKKRDLQAVCSICRCHRNAALNVSVCYSQVRYSITTPVAQHGAGWRVTCWCGEPRLNSQVVVTVTEARTSRHRESTGVSATGLQVSAVGSGWSHWICVILQTCHLHFCSGWHPNVVTTNYLVAGRWEAKEQNVIFSSVAGKGTKPAAMFRGCSPHKKCRKSNRISPNVPKEKGRKRGRDGYVVRWLIVYWSNRHASVTLVWFCLPRDMALLFSTNVLRHYQTGLNLIPAHDHNNI